MRAAKAMGLAALVLTLWIPTSNAGEKSPSFLERHLPEIPVEHPASLEEALAASSPLMQLVQASADMEDHSRVPALLDSITSFLRATPEQPRSYLTPVMAGVGRVREQLGDRPAALEALEEGRKSLGLLEARVTALSEEEFEAGMAKRDRETHQCLMMCYSSAESLVSLARALAREAPDDAERERLQAVERELTALAQDLRPVASGMAR